MNLLVDGKVIIAYASKIEFGVYDEDFEKWALYDSEGNVICYVIDKEYSVIENVELPADFTDGKYFYENGEFILNEGWEPYVSPEEKVAILEKQVIELKRQLANLNGDAVWDEMANAIAEGVNEV